MHRSAWLLLLLTCLVGAEPIADYARKGTCHVYYGIYMLGNKVGWMSVREENVQFRGHQVHVAESTRHMERKAGIFSAKSVQSATVRKYYDLVGPGRLISALDRDVTDGKETVTRVERHGKGLLLTRPGQAPQNIPAIKHTLLENQQIEQWVTKARPGEVRHSNTLNFDKDPIERQLQLKYLGKQSITWGGLPTTAYEVEMVDRGMRGKALIRADGQLWKFKAGPMEIRAESKTLAQKLDSNVDMMAASSIRIQERLGPARKVERLQLEVKNIGNFKFPQSDRQKVSIQNGQTRLSLRRESTQGPPQPLSPAQKKTYLSAAPSLMVNAKTRQLATRILQGNPKNRAAHLQHWVYSRLQKTYSKNAFKSQQVLENMAGDCTEHAMLFVALARAAGIPAREVGGLMYVQGILGGSFAWHAWGEIHNGRRWVAMDPTWDEELIDATHIKMAESLDDYSWMQVLGKIQLTVIPIAPR